MNLVRNAMFPHRPSIAEVRRGVAQRGVTLIVVLIILVIVTIVGIAGARIALLGERSTRFDRDYQIAWEGAEAALIDAESDIAGPNPAPKARVASFGTTDANTSAFVDGCGRTTDANRGLCNQSVTTVPVWQTTGFDFVNEQAADRPFVKYGEMTGRVYQAGTGIQPARLPHYIIEWMFNPDFGGNATASGGNARPIMYRITAIGFGPNQQTQVMMQSTYARKN